MELIGYHGTSKYNGTLILKQGFDITKCVIRDNNWLGKGIYFFADKRYANWWANIKSKGMVLSSHIRCRDNELLDLDNHDDTVNFLRQCSEYQKRFNYNYKDVHQFANVFIDLYKTEFDISVVMRTFPVDGGSFVKLYDVDKNIIRLTGMSLHQKQICVSRKECVFDVKEERYAD
ncbi:MAG: hypothetical protein J6O09_01190 [Lachnospiraceae bacterium]|nr:hypothetical protein [Lachnospiraceae bacterium]